MCVKKKNPFIILTQPITILCTEPCGDKQQCNLETGVCQCRSGHFDVSVGRGNKIIYYRYRFRDVEQFEPKIIFFYSDSTTQRQCAKCCMRFSIINEDTFIKCAPSNAPSTYTCSNGTDQFVMVDDGSKWAMFKSTDFSSAILSSSTTDTSCLDPNLSS